jgi:hypothetical protein
MPGKPTPGRYQPGQRIADVMILENSVSDEQVEVCVSDRWRVVHDDKPYIKDDVLVVPENVAQEWERSGYVERVTGKT